MAIREAVGYSPRQRREEPERGLVGLVPVRAQQALGPQGLAAMQELPRQPPAWKKQLLPIPCLSTESMPPLQRSMQLTPVATQRQLSAMKRYLRPRPKKTLYRLR
jgi:hypothetical protein